MEGFGEKSQLGRPGQPSEIAPSYVFLASGEAELYCKSEPLRDGDFSANAAGIDGQILHPYPMGD